MDDAEAVSGGGGWPDLEQDWGPAEAREPYLLHVRFPKLPKSIDCLSDLLLNHMCGTLFLAHATCRLAWEGDWISGDGYCDTTFINGKRKKKRIQFSYYILIEPRFVEALLGELNQAIWINGRQHGDYAPDFFHLVMKPAVPDEDTLQMLNAHEVWPPSTVAQTFGFGGFSAKDCADCGVRDHWDRDEPPPAW